VSDFDTERAALIKDLGESRSHLVAVVEQLKPDRFEQARRGSWTVSKILDHVLHSERLYTQLISVFSGKPTAVPEAAKFDSAADAKSALDISRSAFLSAVEEVKEDDFFRLQTVGHEEYSVLSILENNAAHDREHAEQIRKTLDAR
jgi:uncharacterized damage-inducible protein DinB